MSHAEEQDPRYLWLCRDLVDPAEEYKPLALWLNGVLLWVEGEPSNLPPVLAEMVGMLEPLLKEGVRFNQTGYGACNIQERDPFMLDHGKNPLRVGSRVTYPCAGVRYAGVVRVIRPVHHVRTKRVWLEARCDNGAPDNADMATNGFSCAGNYEGKQLRVLRF